MATIPRTAAFVANEILSAAKLNQNVNNILDTLSGDEGTIEFRGPVGFPRYTNSERNALVGVPVGATIWNSTESEIQVRGSDGMWHPITSPSIGGASFVTLSQVNQLISSHGYLNQTQTDARVRLITADWAEVDSTAAIPLDKLRLLPTPISLERVQQEIRTIVVDWAEDQNHAQIPLNKLGNAVAQIVNWAKAGNAGLIPDSKISATIARVSQLPSNTTVDSRIAIWARTGDTSIIPASKLPAGSSGSVTTAQIDGRIAVWARTGNTSMIPVAKMPAYLSSANLVNLIVTGVNTGVHDWAEAVNTDAIPDAKIPSTITRDTELPSADQLVPTTGNTNGRFLSRVNGANAWVAAPTSGGSVTNDQIDGRVRSIVSDWAETGNSSRIPSTKMPTNVPLTNSASNVVFQTRLFHNNPSSASNTTESATTSWVRDLVDDLSIPDNNAIDARIADWAEAGNTSDIPSTKMPTTVPLTNASSVAFTGRLFHRTPTSTSNTTESATTEWVRDYTVSVPTGGSNGQYLQRTSGGYRWNTVTATVSNTQIDARIADWAEAGNSSRIPSTKMPTTVPLTNASSVAFTGRLFHASPSSTSDTTESATTAWVRDRIRVSTSSPSSSTGSNGDVWIEY